VPREQIPKINKMRTNSIVCEQETIEDATKSNPITVGTPQILRSKSGENSTVELGLKLENLNNVTSRPFGNDNPEKQLEEQLNYELEKEIESINELRRASMVTIGSSISKKGTRRQAHTDIKKI
jgi:hypothetical protein